VLKLFNISATKEQSAGIQRLVATVENKTLTCSFVENIKLSSKVMTYQISVSVTS
jgi:hypothetical protein